MFGSHELVYTRDPKTGAYSGGGYALKSELLTGGVPPLIALSGGRKNRRRSGGIESGSGSGSGSDNDSDGSKSKSKVSSILSQHSSIVIPAGLFLIHGSDQNVSNGNGSNGNDDDNDVDASSFNTANAKLRSFLYNPDNDALSDDSSDDGAPVARKQNNVIPDDLYTALFKMLSPNDADKKRYWVSSAVTCRRRRQKPASAAASHKTTRKHKK